uniref:GTP-binding protein n=1 Tax=Skeletonema marinoi TaxID=267567 RepID=A0A7S2PXQ8_9STRA
MAKKKVLLMGKAHSGKTSMRSIIFANYLARDTMRLSPTLDVEHHHVRFLGDLVLNLWDCGGQDAFYESYFERDRETIFRSVELLIYVFDIESDCPEKDFDHFAGVLEAMEENSPDARIFVLVHKMDLVAEEERELILEDRKRLIEESCLGVGVQHFQCFGTSIWDETLYKAWSEIVTNLIPNIGVLESHLSDFCRICDADEVVLFERATFLVISHAQAKRDNSDDGGGGVKGLITDDKEQQHHEEGNEDGADINGETGWAENADDLAAEKQGEMSTSPHSQLSSPIHDAGDDGMATPQTPASPGGGNATHTAAGSTAVVSNQVGGKASSNQITPSPTPQFDAHRFEKISNIVKQFKLSCGKAQSQFQGMDVRNSKFTAFIDAFTANTYIMVIVSSKTQVNGQEWGTGVHKAATLLNIQKARSHFEQFIPRS